MRHIGCSFITSGYGRRDLDHLVTCWVYLWNYSSFYLRVIHACYVHDGRVTQIDAIGHWLWSRSSYWWPVNHSGTFGTSVYKRMPQLASLQSILPHHVFAVLLNIFRRISNHLTHRLHISIFNFNIFIFKNLFVSPSLVLC